ncbi:MAG TPA: dihydrofolate reductase family protein [Acidimicrobiales bacterium]|nr:dihydrofolate reductase family protein [Acidimicrobiales bacterium]
MATLTVIENLSLDGVMQAPGRPDEDERDGFAHGGWAIPYNDEVLGRVMGEHMARDSSLLLGRRTYEDFAGFWPRQTDNPFTAVLEARTKYVVSSTLQEPLPWANSVLLRGDAAEAVAGVMQRTAEDLVVLGSGELVRALAAGGLVDEYLLVVHPLVLGSGRRLFPDRGPRQDLRLVDSVTTTTGATVATFAPG